MMDIKEEIAKIIRNKVKDFCKDEVTFYNTFKAQINRQIKEVQKKNSTVVLSTDELRQHGEHYAETLINAVNSAIRNSSFEHIISDDIVNKYAQNHEAEEVDSYCTKFAKDIIKGQISVYYKHIKRT